MYIRSGIPVKNGDEVTLLIKNGSIYEEVRCIFDGIDGAYAVVKEKSITGTRMYATFIGYYQGPTFLFECFVTGSENTKNVQLHVYLSDDFYKTYGDDPNECDHRLAYVVARDTSHARALFNARLYTSYLKTYEQHTYTFTEIPLELGANILY